MRDHRRVGRRSLQGGDLLAEIRDAARAGGLDALRIADAAPFLETRAHLEERKAAGLHGGMAFTYRRPERSTDPSLALPGARTLVVGARSYLPEGDAGGAGEGGAGEGGAGEGGAGVATAVTAARTSGDAVPRGRVARSARRDEYALLKAGLGAVGKCLKAAGYRARVLADDNALVDRAAAYRAGIGWWGKNTLILLPGLGSWFVLGSVLTDAALPPDTGPLEDRCGRCFRCAPACPTGAIVAPGVLDARRCLSWVLEAPGPIPRELREAVGDRIYGCDACQEACPPNRAVAMRATRVRLAKSRPVHQLADRGGRGAVDLVEMLGATDSELLDRYGHFYLAGRDPALLRRNALVVLGNIASGDDTRVVGAVQSALRSPAPIVRAHAVWAAGRIGRADLLSGSVLRDEQDPAVKDELAELPPPRR